MTGFVRRPNHHEKCKAIAAVFNSPKHRAVVASMAAGVPPLRPVADQVMAALRRHLRPMPSHIRDFIGIPASVVAADFPVAIADVVFEDEDAFTFAGPECDPATARQAVVGACIDEFGEVGDAFAWSMKTGVVASYAGRAGVNDAQHALGARIDEALTIHPDPGAWLRAGRRGVFLVDLTRAAPILRDAAPLLAPTHHFATALRRGLSIPAPRIIVAGAALARTAA